MDGSVSDFGFRPTESSSTGPTRPPEIIAQMSRYGWAALGFPDVHVTIFPTIRPMSKRCAVVQRSEDFVDSLHRFGSMTDRLVASLLYTWSEWRNASP